MKSIQQIIETVLVDTQPAVLAMIVDIEGSSYRKEGTWMLIQENGVQIGMISGGCLENDLHSHATQLFRTGKAITVQYDLSSEDDLGWGRGAGCNGVVTVLVRDIDENFRNILDSIHKQIQANEPTYFLQSMTDFSQYGCLTSKGHHFGEVQANLTLNFNNLIPFQRKVGQINSGEDSVYFQLIWPQPLLYIIGAGVDARPLARLSENLGYAVHLFDWRSGICDEIYFPTAASIQIGNVSKLLSNVKFSPMDSVVLMTHDFQLDYEIGRHLLEFKLLYFGILGSKKRTKRLFDGKLPNSVHSPVGLSIGADGPEEIAVSIVSELIAVRRGVNS
ncbi:XdhC family protein [Sporosarcina sp. P34]|uniref:XdhC family protein n=1 Tax=Sporosarcina sp. P34 TaxID=2048247 RepID=UPI0013040C2F|nr:XdhC family protein [Sporosarcina sp. P34]